MTPAFFINHTVKEKNVIQIFWFYNCLFLDADEGEEIAGPETALDNAESDVCRPDESTNLLLLVIKIYLCH